MCLAIVTAAQHRPPLHRPPIADAVTLLPSHHRNAPQAPCVSPRHRQHHQPRATGGVVTAGASSLGLSSLTYETEVKTPPPTAEGPALQSWRDKSPRCPNRGHRGGRSDRGLLLALRALTEGSLPLPPRSAVPTGDPRAQPAVASTTSTSDGSVTPLKPSTAQRALHRRRLDTFPVPGSRSAQMSHELTFTRKAARSRRRKRGKQERKANRPTPPALAPSRVAVQDPARSSIIVTGDASEP